MSKKLILVLNIVLLMFFLVGCFGVDKPEANQTPQASFSFTPSNPKAYEQVVFDGSSSYDSHDRVEQLQARWDFNGDGNWEVEYYDGKRASHRVSHTYTVPGTYTVILEVKDSGGLTSSRAQSIKVAASETNQAPTASFSFSPSSPLVNEQVTFDPTTTTDAEDTLSQVIARWDFDGNGTWDLDYNQNLKASQRVVYTYSTPGTYSVILEVKDTGGLISRLQKSIEVRDTVVVPPNQAPTASFSYSPGTPSVYPSVTFSPLASSDEEDATTNLATRWDFNGDGIWDADYNEGLKATDEVSYTYNQVGTYKVYLEVKDTGGLTSKLDKTVTVINHTPVASFTFSPNEPGIFEPVTFDPRDSIDAEEELYQLQARWDFDGDGYWEIDYSDGKRASDVVTYSYSEVGSYNAVLEVMDSNGSTGDKIRIVTVSTYQINGHITESRGGAGISGATVTLVSETGKFYTGTTDSYGAFVFNVDEYVSHDLTVTKAGYATSKSIGLLPNQIYCQDLNIPLLEEFYANWGNNPPVVTLGLPNSSASQPVGGSFSFSVSATHEQEIKQGAIQYGPQGYENEIAITGLPFTTTLDTRSLPNGKIYVRVSMYDVNGNYVEVYEDLYVENLIDETPLVAPSINNLTAVTWGSSLHLLSDDQVQKLGQQISPQMDQSDWQVQVAEADSTIMTIVEWNSIYGASGYKVYRSATQDGDYQLVGVINDRATRSFYDTSSVLTPGSKVYYRVSAYDLSGESELSEPVYTIPLEPFRVNLTSPAFDAVVTTLTPTFTWSPERLVGDTQTYNLVVRGVTDAGEFWNTEITDGSTSVTYSGITPFQRGKEYEWDLVEAVAERKYSTNSKAISGSSTDYGAMNGWFRFIVQL